MPRAIWTLGFVSMLMDISSELIHALVPIFMVTTLGLSALTVGIVEGIAEATASITKVFSGALSDWIGKRKPLVVLGYGLAAFTKPLFPLASSAWLIITARFLDRVGKGIRGAPRDALISDIAPPSMRGAAFGLRQALDTVGAFVGPLAAIGLMLLFADDIRTVLWFAVVPAFLAFFLITVAIREPKRASADRPKKFPISRSELAKLGQAYWLIVAVGAVLTLARFSEAFLILRAQNIGMALAWIPMVLVVMSVVYSAAAYPAGILSDRFERRRVLLVGVVFLIAADLVLAKVGSVSGILLGTSLWGLHMGFTQGLLATLVADTSPVPLRGTAFGVFNLVCGVMVLFASAVAGLFWELWGPETTFIAGAAITACAFAGLLFVSSPGRLH